MIDSSEATFIRLFTQSMDTLNHDLTISEVLEACSPEELLEIIENQNGGKIRELALKLQKLRKQSS
jgi:hypothetical protein